MKGFVFFVLATCLLVCCDSSEKKALVLLDEAREAVIYKQFDKARALVDSLRKEYPRELDVRRSALVFSDTIEMEEARMLLADADSVLASKELVLEALKTGFVLEKNEKYQTVGYYVCPEQISENMHRTSLRAEVNEEGQMLLISILHGTKLGHNRVRMTSSSGESVETPPCFSLLTHSVDGYEEEASYKLGEDNGVIACIAENTGNTTVFFVSPDGKEMKVNVTASDVSAVRKCHELALAFAAADSVRAVRDKLAVKVRFFEKKIMLGK
ncbi:MAG: hypothetical protein NC206_09990 [Bacteroides sp.]|nr:hypothetical protein [Roseburia sp.]MCM1347399.1 hypothetical protein [Bacteroides sp.]MCM1421893.1 hypothetical protein [Bacteroides sp.]